jgi:hypothetical protein
MALFFFFERATRILSVTFKWFLASVLYEEVVISLHYIGRCWQMANEIEVQPTPNLEVFSVEYTRTILISLFESAYECDIWLLFQ